MSLASIDTTPSPPERSPVIEPSARYFSWSSIVAGALVAAACFFVATAFATAIGLAVSSVSPTWRDTSVGLVVLSGAWIVFTAIGSFALGGYIAGRTRLTWQGTADDVHFRDGLYGLAMWAVGVCIGVALLWASAATVSQAGRTAVSNSSTAEPAFLSYEIDRLFRSEARPGGNDAESRAEAGRILQRGVGRTDLPATDRDYLARLVAIHSGLPPTDAAQRVNQVLADAKEAAHQARKSAIIIGFTLAAALVAAAGAAWGSAIIGGRQRDGGISPSLYFRRRSGPSF
jgi:hypothetical protein